MDECDVGRRNVEECAAMLQGRRCSRAGGAPGREALQGRRCSRAGGAPGQEAVLAWVEAEPVGWGERSEIEAAALV